MHVDDGRLIVNAERWYDAAGTARDTTLVLDANDLDGPVSGYLEMDGAVHAGGYMSEVPPEWRDMLGGPLLTSWAANTSIISRHSVGTPSAHRSSRSTPLTSTAMPRSTRRSTRTST
jgi:hypothetical protein